MTKQGLHIVFYLVYDVNMTGVVCELLAWAQSLWGAQGEPSITKLISEQEDIHTKHEADRY